jgi:Flp pilus assembly protein TadG
VELTKLAISEKTGMPSLNNSRERGVSVMIFTLVSVLVVIPLMGLAIDGSIGFWVKAKLSAALDAAALAAGRSPTANATTVVQEYVYANFPVGWMGTSFSVAPTATVSYPTSGTRQVTVTAAVTVPQYFMAIFGHRTAIVSALAQSSRRNTNLMLVLDRSSSMNTTGPDGALICNTMIASATTFVNYFTNGQDQLGLVSFHTWANVDYPFNTNFQTSSPNLTSVLGDLVCGENTSSAEALNLAYTQITNLGSAAYANNGALNVIVFFTDGNPNGIVGTFPPKDRTDDRYYANSGFNSTIYSGMPKTTTSCISALPSAAAGVIVQWSGGGPTGLTQGIYQIPVPAPTSVCGSGQSRAICNTNLTALSVSGCYFAGSPWNTSVNYPAIGPSAPRQDIAYIPLLDAYGDSTVNSAFMTQANDLVTGTYATSGAMRIDTPQSVTDASFNAADAQALQIISDTVYKPVIYTIGLGGAADMSDESVFQAFLQRVANDPSSSRYNASLPTGSFVYSPNDTQLAAAFHQVASQILRLSK